MTETVSARRRAPVFLIVLLLLLFLITAALVAAIVHGFYFGWLAPYWASLSEPQATIITQVVFVLAAAWAAVLVPLLFAEQLQNLEQAAKRAEATYAQIETVMQKAADNSREQFESITRLQLMSIGYLLDPRQLDALQSPDARRAYVLNAWNNAKQQVDAAIELQNGNRRNALDELTYRSTAWWEKVKAYEVLGSFYLDFKNISDKRNKQLLSPEDLYAVNEATRRIQTFDPGSSSSPMNGTNGVIVVPPPDSARELRQ